MIPALAILHLFFPESACDANGCTTLTSPSPAPSSAVSISNCFVPNSYLDGVSNNGLGGISDNVFRGIQPLRLRTSTAKLQPHS